MFPKRNYLVKYGTSMVVEAASHYDSWDELREKLKAGSGDPNFDPEKDIDIEDSYESYKEYEVKISTGTYKIFAEYHRDTMVMPHGNGEDPSGCYFDRPNHHTLFIPTGAFERIGINIINDKLRKESADDVTSIKEQIFAIEDALIEPRRNYIVKYETSAIVEASTYYGALDALRERLKAASKDPDFDPHDDIDINGAYETAKEYTVNISTGVCKIQAEYHRDTKVMPSRRYQKPRSGYRIDRENGHILFITTEELEKAGVTRDEDKEAIKTQICALEDVMGEHDKYNQIVETLKKARKGLPEDPGTNSCYRCSGKTHEHPCICTADNLRRSLGCCSKCRGWGTIQMFIESMFESSLRSELVRAWEWLHETGRCQPVSKDFWPLMLEAADLLDIINPEEL